MMLVAAPTIGSIIAVGLLTPAVGRSAMMLDAALLDSGKSRSFVRTNMRRVSERSILGLLRAVLMLETLEKEHEPFIDLEAGLLTNSYAFYLVNQFISFSVSRLFTVQ